MSEQNAEKAQHPDAFRHSNGRHHFESFLAEGIACTNPALGCAPVWFSGTPPGSTSDKGDS